MNIELPFVVAGLVTGLLVGMTGVGAGAVMTPLLILFFGIVPTVAVATDLWFAAITKMVGVIIHRRAGQVDWQVVLRLLKGSLPVAILAILMMSSRMTFLNTEWLMLAIGLAVLVTSAGLLLAPILGDLARTYRLKESNRFKMLQPAMTVLAGAVIAMLVTLTSVGAGVLGSVALMMLYPLRMTPHRMVATDLAHAVPLAVVAGLGYLLAGLVNTALLLNLLLGSLPGVVLGSLLATKMPSRLLQIVLSGFLMMLGLKAIGKL
jgi:uncharacterized membrane protein YfcA